MKLALRRGHSDAVFMTASVAEAPSPFLYNAESPIATKLLWFLLIYKAHGPIAILDLLVTIIISQRLDVAVPDLLPGRSILHSEGLRVGIINQQADCRVVDAHALGGGHAGYKHPLIRALHLEHGAWMRVGTIGRNGNLGIQGEWGLQ